MSWCETSSSNMSGDETSWYKKVRGRNVQVQNVRGRKVLVENVMGNRPGPKCQGRNVLDQIVGGEASRSKMLRGETSWSSQGTKRPGPKCQGVKCPGPKCQGVKRPCPKRSAAKHPGPITSWLWNFLGLFYDWDTPWDLFMIVSLPGASLSVKLPWAPLWLWTFLESLNECDTSNVRLPLWLWHSLRLLYDCEDWFFYYHLNLIDDSLISLT